MDDERTRYVGVATGVAVRGVREALEERGLGRLESWENVQDENGDWLQLIFESRAHGSVRIRYSRLLLPATGPDKDPETAGMIFSASFEERLRTRTPSRPEGPPDDVLTL